MAASNPAASNRQFHTGNYESAVRLGEHRQFLTGNYESVLTLAGWFELPYILYGIDYISYLYY